MCVFVKMLSRVCVNMLRTNPSVAAASFGVYRMQSTDAGHLSGSFSKRERAAEESYAAKREAEAMRRLTEKLRANSVDEDTVWNMLLFAFISFIFLLNSIRFETFIKISKTPRVLLIPLFLSLNSFNSATLFYIFKIYLIYISSYFISFVSVCTPLCAGYCQGNS